MTRDVPQWLAPTTLEEALELRARFGDEATVVAGGTFIGILMSQRIMMPTALLALRNVGGLAFIEENQGDHTTTGGSPLRIGALTTHRAVERSALIRQDWPILAHTFSLVASPRIRNQATVGGVLADADYASDPPAMLCALDARAVARSLHGEREIPIEELITGYYETSLCPDELLTEVRIPHQVERAVYRKFRSRSSEDRPCVAVAAAQINGKLRLVVGAVAERPQYFPAICSLADEGRNEATLASHAPTPLVRGYASRQAHARNVSGGYNRELAAEIGRRYAEAIQPIADSRGSAEYRRRVIAVEVRRALEEMYP